VASDVEIRYVLRLVCRNDDEAKVRMLLMHLLHALPLTLHALHSEDLNSSGKVEVRAMLVSAERQNALDRLQAAEEDLTTYERHIPEELQPYAGQLGLPAEIPGVDWTLAAVIIAEPRN
jgi:hypothetical protein